LRKMPRKRNNSLTKPSRFNKTIFREYPSLFVPFLLTASMLTVIQPPFGLSFLAWAALVPFVLGCSPKTKTRPLAATAYLVSLLYWLANLYWIFPITIIGWFALCVYMALLWPIAALVLRYCREKKLPLLLMVPIVFVGCERLQGAFLGGFFWRFLGHSQYANITLIQIADIFGAAGVSFVIGLVNGLLAELIISIRQGKFHLPGAILKTALVCLVLGGVIIYGRWRIKQADECIETGPLVAALQSNIPQSVKRSFEASDVIFEDLLEQSEAAARAGARLIIWPETMVQAPLNKDVWPFLSSERENWIEFDKALSKQARQGLYLLVGAYGAEIKQAKDGSAYLGRYNSAFLYGPEGRQLPYRYDKIHLVPFGEFVPFRRKLPALYDFLMKFTPYNYDYSLEAGTQYTVFEMTGAGPNPRKYNFAVIICYEDTIPGIARRFTLDQQGRKLIHWLVNISNDGWFVRFRNKKVIASTELAQHTAVCVFRAVENRLAVVRSVNTGISCLIDSLGRIRNNFVAGENLPAEAMKRGGIAGWFADKVPIDKRVTFFSKYGQWLDFCCAACLVLLLAVPSLAKVVAGSRAVDLPTGKTNGNARKRRSTKKTKGK